MKKRVKSEELVFLVNEKSNRENTKYIHFNELCLNDYLKENKNTNLAKVIFAVRSKSFDIKKWQSLKYDDNLCVKCKIKEEKWNILCPAKHMKTHPMIMTGKMF